MKAGLLNCECVASTENFSNRISDLKYHQGQKKDEVDPSAIEKLGIIMLVVGCSKREWKDALELNWVLEFQKFKTLTRS